MKIETDTEVQQIAKEELQRLEVVNAKKRAKLEEEYWEKLEPQRLQFEWEMRHSDAPAGMSRIFKEMARVLRRQADIRRELKALERDVERATAQVVSTLMDHLFERIRKLEQKT